MGEDVKGTRMYVVLCRPEDITEHQVREDDGPGREIVTVHGGWAMAGEYEAANDLAAIKLAKAANSGEPRNAEWVGVPARSWRPRKAVTETKTVERWS